MKISQFPADGSPWVVKWVDRFRTMHAATTSASVTVQLQRLDWIGGPEEFQSLHSTDLPALLGRSDAAAHSFRSTEVLAALGCALELGSVFIDGELIAHLPTATRALSIPLGAAQIRQARLSTMLPQELGVDRSYRKYPLNAFQYQLASSAAAAKNLFGDSRVIILRDETTEIILPHFVIFRTFFACHTELALAFTSGPWASTMESVVRLQPMENGLATGVDPATGDWHIVLQPRVPDELARIVALLVLSPAGLAAANRIYTAARQDLIAHEQLARSQGEPHSPGCWYCAADFPFEPGCTLDLRVSGMYLKPWHSSMPVRKFLVTRIDSIRQPSYLPQIYCGRVNSGSKGELVQQTQLEAPYARNSARLIERARGDAVLTNQSDAQNDSLTQVAPIWSCQWDAATDVRPMVKATSTTAAPATASCVQPSAQVSPGHRRGSGDAQSLSFEPNSVSMSSRMRLLIDVLVRASCDDPGFLWRVVPALQAARAERRDGLSCWNLRTAPEIAGLSRPAARQWRVLSSVGGRITNWRAVLIAHISWSHASFLWFEIECRATEGYRSAIVRLPNNSQQGDNEHSMVTAIIDVVLEVVAEAKGRDVADRTCEGLARLGCLVTSYKHDFDNMQDAAMQGQTLKADSVTRALRRLLV